MSQLFYYLILKPLSFLPLPVLHTVSTFLYYLLYRLAGYRKEVVSRNLKNSFPDKTPMEIEKIMRRFYRHFFDIIVESIRVFSMPKEELIARCKILNPEIFDPFYESGKSVLIIAGHYNNWELAALSFDLQIEYQCAAPYQLLKNAFMNKKLQQSRERFGIEFFPKKETRSYFQNNRERRLAIMFAADQSPTFSKRVYWTQFLNQETAVLFGSEKYAKDYNYPAVFARINKAKRGYYEVVFEIVDDNPAASPHGEITEKHTRMLEKQILEDPAYWLWTHKRWKRKKNADTEITKP